MATQSAGVLSTNGGTGLAETPGNYGTGVAAPTGANR
jgi:hypothetical protein